jgi:uncharacterized protein (DUF58 family)
MLTRSGVVVAVAAVLLLGLGWLADYPELVVLALAGVAALVTAGAWMLLRPDLAVVRDVRPDRVTAGDAAMGVITVTNEARRRSPPILAVEAVAGHHLQVAVPSLGSGQSHRTSYPLPTERRGVYQVGPLTIGHTDPLRLMQVGQTYCTYSTLYVHPKLHMVEPVPTGRTRDMDGPTSSFSQQGGVAFHSLREYEPGDDWRLIHWKSTARSGRTMVRHNVVPNQPRLMVVLDTNASAYSDSSFEHAVSAAASLAFAGIRGGFPLELRTTSGAAVATDRIGAGALSVLDLLAAAERVKDDPGLSAIPRMISLDDSVALGVVTGQPDPATLSVLPAVRRHFLMISLIQFADQFAAPPAALHGIVSLTVRRTEEFVAAWNQLVRT